MRTMRSRSTLQIISLQREKSRSSAPLKKCVSHTAFVRLSIVELVESLSIVTTAVVSNGICGSSC